MNTRKIIATIAAVTGILAFTACTAAETAQHNNKRASEQFKVQRRVVFFNGITDEYLLEIEGRCSIHPDGEYSKLDVICKVDDKEYKRHMLGLSDNVSYFVEQMEPNESDPYRYRIIFRPEAIIPDMEIDTSAGTIG